jgi:hypothetical protein
MAMQMDPLAGLSDDAQKVLQLIVRQRVTDGSTLMKHMGIAKRDSAVAALQDLESRDLIELAGPITTADELPFSRFGVRPSAKDYVDQALKYLKKK